MIYLLTKGDIWRLSIITGFVLFALHSIACERVLIDWVSFRWTIPSSCLLIAIWLYYGWRNENAIDARVSRFAIITAQLVLFSNVAVIGNYLGFCYQRQLYDEFIADIDRYIGINWWQYVLWIKSNAISAKLTTGAYRSTGAQIFLIFFISALVGSPEKFERFTLASMIATAITIIAWIIFPTFGALPLHYAHGLPQPTFELVMSRTDAFELLDLHKSNFIKVDANHLLGLIGLPSFHAVLAIITVYAAWEFYFLRVFAIMINIFVMLSIPADGGHHFFDLFAGIILAAASIALSHRLLQG